jgi:hypothetical protein
MSNIQIKRYNGNTTTWENLYPITYGQNIISTNGNTPLLDSNGKLNAVYLPNAIFDSLYFNGDINGVLQDEQLQEATLTDLASHAYFSITNRDVKGVYYVATNQTTVTASATSTAGAYQSGGGLRYFKSYFASREEGLSTGGSSVVLETGDWIVVTKIEGGNGSIISAPIEITFAVVNNTYELAATNAPGIVTLSNQTVWANLAGNNVITDARLKALADGQFQPQLNSLADRVRVYYDGTPTGMVTNDLWFDAV